MKRLVIAEKDSSAAKIATILSGGSQKTGKVSDVRVHRFESDGHEYVVVGLRGHIVNWDYPGELSSWSKVESLELVWAEPEKRTTQEHIVQALRTLSKGVDEVVIATDYDREGELIGVEALEVIRQVNKGFKVQRARFSALTPGEVKPAFARLQEVDYPLARSAESRQIVDLAWGATLTRLVSTSARQVWNNYLSIGRVQSPTLALIVEREEKVESFVPKAFWTLGASFHKQVTFVGQHHHGRFWDRGEARGILDKLSGAEEGTVVEYTEREKRERPPVPLNTTAFLTEATRMGMTAYKAMSIAEDLYNAGIISYPRTDNTVYPKSLPIRQLLEKLRASDLRLDAEEVLASRRPAPMRGKKQTTDHPPIHPVEGATKAQLKGNRWRIYELIARRFIATLAPDSNVMVSKAVIEVREERFRCEGSKLLRPGWRKYYPYNRLREAVLPRLEQGEAVQLLGLEMQQGETKPPARFTQGTLIQEMERKGLGTKATRHEIIKKLYDRKYIQGTSIKPTPSGKALIAALKGHAERITKPEMTSHLEDEMQLVAQGDKELRDVVNESRVLLHDSVKTLEKHREEVGEQIREALRTQRVLGTCVECGSQLVIRFPRRGGRPFVGCEGYPECRVTYNLPPRGFVEPAGVACASCRVPMVRLTVGRTTEERCINPKCEVFLQKNRVGTCPSCGGDLLIRSSRNNKRFAGCSNYPKCEVTYPLPQRGFIESLGKACEECGSPMVRVLAGRPWTTCINMECPSRGKGRRARKPQASKGS